MSATGDLETKAFAWLDGHFEEAVSFWTMLVDAESPFWDKPSVDGVCTAVQEKCTEAGLSVRRFSCATTGDGLSADLPSASPEKTIALMAHMDTVHAKGSFGSPAAQIRGGWLCGPGAGDCKGGLVMALYTVLALRAAGYARPLRLIFVGNEEGGRPDAENFIPDELRGCRALFNCETGEAGRIVTSRMASIGAEFTVSGKSEHVGRLHGAPASAIREAACKILELEKRSDYRDWIFSCGEIRGGTVFTSVPDRCSFRMNCRIRQASQAPELLRLLRDAAQRSFVPGTETVLRLTGNLLPMEPSAANECLFRRMASASLELGYGRFLPVSSGGASDASFAVQLGIPAVCATGVETTGGHTLQERAEIESLRRRARIHIRTILRMDESVK